MSLFSQFATDPQKEREGINIVFPPNDDGTIPSFRVRRRSDRNQEYAKMLKRETEQYRRQIDMGMLDDMVSRAILMKVFCSTVLLGWDNVQDKDNKPIVFSPENAIALFNELGDLYNDLISQSDKASNFRRDEVEQERKN